ncbi:MAG: TIGR02117 family protein [Cyclobacteriaceae bacterium]|nr:TIGR02117 family protein [Cyclobacteriaceae bacterium]
MWAAFFNFILVYFVASLLLGYIPVNTGFTQPENGTDIFIRSNGVHTDFVLPMVNDHMDWRSYFDPADFGRKMQFAPYIAFGWGDRGFYLNTPEWSDLTPGTAIKAMFIHSPSAMHVTLYGQPDPGKHTRKIRVSPAQYIMIRNYILDSFITDPNGRPVRIDHPGYGTADLFYESALSFHLFRTCNVWTNNGLIRSDIRTSAWTPFDKPILYQLSRIN